MPFVISNKILIYIHTNLHNNGKNVIINSLHQKQSLILNLRFQVSQIRNIFTYYNVELLKNKIPQCSSRYRRPL